MTTHAMTRDELIKDYGNLKFAIGHLYDVHPNLRGEGWDFLEKLEPFLNAYPTYLAEYVLRNEAFGGLVREQAFDTYVREFSKGFHSDETQLIDFFCNYRTITLGNGLSHLHTDQIYPYLREAFELSCEIARPEDNLLEKYPRHCAGFEFHLAHTEYTAPFAFRFYPVYRAHHDKISRAWE